MILNEKHKCRHVAFETVPRTETLMCTYSFCLYILCHPCGAEWAQGEAHIHMFMYVYIYYTHSCTHAKDITRVRQRTSKGEYSFVHFGHVFAFAKNLSSHSLPGSSARALMLPMLSTMGKDDARAEFVCVHIFAHMRAGMCRHLCSLSLFVYIVCSVRALLCALTEIMLVICQSNSVQHPFLGRRSRRDKRVRIASQQRSQWKTVFEQLSAVAAHTCKRISYMLLCIYRKFSIGEHYTVWMNEHIP